MGRLGRIAAVASAVESMAGAHGVELVSVDTSSVFIPSTDGDGYGSRAEVVSVTFIPRDMVEGDRLAGRLQLGEPTASQIASGTLAHKWSRRFTSLPGLPDSGIVDVHVTVFAAPPFYRPSAGTSAGAAA